MADDKSKRGGSDRSRVSASEEYEVDHFAEQNGITPDETRALIARVGNDRKKLEAALAEERSAKVPSAAPKRPRKAPATRKKPQDAGPAIAAPVVAVARRAAAGTRRSSDAARKSVVAVPRAGRNLVAAGAARTADAARSGTGRSLGIAAAGLVAGLVVNLGRKAVVQAPSALAGDWFDAVKAEHRMALSLFDKLQSTSDEQAAKRRTLLAQLKHALSKHAFMEENVLYPALRDHGDKADADKLNHDHGYVKQYLYELDNLDAASPAFLVTLAKFRRDIEEHIEEEEQTIFPPLHKALGEAANSKLTVQANKEAFKLA
ncbi:MAG TPA: hemerythrin domain-containing protein [Sphingomonas sp.]|jgi:hemerythrin superfamily protein|nr:hemerythrin domain-containing protein [Sphingomonas sp.]